MNPYEELGVPADARSETIRKAFLRRAKKTHPDNGGDPEEFDRAKRSYDLFERDAAESALKMLEGYVYRFERQHMRRIRLSDVEITWEDKG